MASPNVQGQLGQVLIDFSTDGRFPEEEAISSAYAETSVIPSALEALSFARSDLEVLSTIYTLSRLGK
jgi:centromere/kinetochore protein ZW10